MNASIPRAFWDALKTAGLLERSVPTP